MRLTLLLTVIAVSPLVADEKPNIILCMADDQGWGDVGYNSGFPQLKTPTLDEMAATGLRFNRFYSAAPVCSPTRGSVLTGRHPNRFGCFSWGYTIRPEEVTVAEALQNAGYATGHFGKWHLGSTLKASPLSPGKNGFDTWVSMPNFYENDPLASDNGTVRQLKGESSMATVEAALPFMKQSVEQKKPFLSVIWFGSPHVPHVASPKLAKMYEGLPKPVQNYLGELTGIDQAMGRLRKELDSMGVRDNTILWYTSDNGAQGVGSTKGLRGKKAQLWEGGIRVPAIIEWPSHVKKRRQTDVPCNTVDIYPTLLDIVGISPKHQPKLDGVSLLSLIDDNGLSQRPGFGFWDYPIKGQRTPSDDWLKQQRQGAKTEDAFKPWYKPLPNGDRAGHAAWMEGNFKLHRIPDKKGNPRFELYNLADDANEKNNIITDHPDKEKAMKQQLEAWQASVVGSLKGNDYEQ